MATTHRAERPAEQSDLVAIDGDVRYEVQWRGTTEWFPTVWHDNEQTAKDWLLWHRENHPTFAWRLVKVETGIVKTRVL